MPASKTHSPSNDASDHRDIRGRVVKACQRCRLKKCKCDGASPCARCKSDDAICAYGKHKKTDKIVFRKGYVQMLERQHAQLIAALQELYRRTQNGQGWTAPPLELGSYGQPLTHKILEGLGILRADEWADEESQGDMSAWLNSEEQDLDGGGVQYDDSATPSPTTTHTFSPSSVPQLPFPDSQIMTKRRSKFELPTCQDLDMTPMTGPSIFNNESIPYSEPSFPKPGHYDHDLHLAMPPTMPLLSSNCNNVNNNPSYAHGNNKFVADQNLTFENVDWMHMREDMLESCC